MLDEDLKNKIRITINSLSSNINGFNKRFVQNKMIAEVAKVLSGEYPQHILCVEAPTGIGKTFAYLSSGIVIAKALDVKLIISSSNVALQEQLELKDVPDMMNYSALDFKFALVKGRSRYLCLRNLVQIVDEVANSNPLFDTTMHFNQPPEHDDIANLQGLLDEFETRKWNGEFDALDKKIAPDLWNKINCNRWTCSASRCDFYHECVFFKARKKIHNADVIIANHDLVLADITSGNKILPDLSDSFIIFDEAHHLPQKALSHFAYNCSLDNIKNTHKNAVIIIKKIINIINRGQIKAFKHIDDNVKDVQNFLKDLNYEEDTYLFKMGLVDENLLFLVDNLKQSFIQLSSYFIDIKDDFISYQKINPTENNIAQLDNVMGECEMHITSISEALENFTLIDNSKTPPQSRWIKKFYQGKNKNNYYLNSAKIDVSNSLASILWSKVRACVLTSATLSSLGSFSRLNAQLSLSEATTQYLRLPSPFDLHKVNLIIEKMQYAPQQVSQHTTEVAEKMLNYIRDNSGCLVLFASNNQMQEVADIVENEIENLLIQGQYSKKNILAKHIAFRKNQQTSVIFGLDSFAEGVDLKGNYLTVVMIAKLRFSMPNSPVEKTTSDYLTSQGSNAFSEVSLPDVSLRLTQACGRLIRTETDEGKIVIFDKRLVSKSYGNNIINSLPDYNIVIQ